MKNKIILLADDHPLMLKGLVNEFKEHGFLKLYQAKNGLEALQIILDIKPDIAFLDIDMPYLNGLEVAEKVKNFSTKIIILTQHKEEGFLQKIKSIGAVAYLLKEDDFQEIETALASIEQGNFYVSSSIDYCMVESGNEKLRSLKKLSNSEIKVLQLIANSNTTTQIATTLSLSPRTIEKHRSNIIHKLAIKKDRDALKNFILENKLLIESL